MLRTCLCLIPIVLLGACNRTPSFDERYDAQAKTLQGAANGIEQEVANQISGADATARAAREIGNGAGSP